MCLRMSKSMLKSQVTRSQIAALCLIASAAAPQAQQDAYRERVEVARILVDVRVLGDHGLAMSDLGVDDFAVKIGGKAARVESALWVSGAAPEPELLESRELREDPGAAAGRLIVFVFQKSLEPSRIVGFMKMLIEARGLVDMLHPRDRVAVLSFDSRLRIWVDFSNDFEAIRRIFHRGILFERIAPVQASLGPSLMARLDPLRASRTYTIEGALRRIGEAIADLPGAKSVILVGHGFGRFGPSGVSMENEYGAMRTALQAARASVFSLDVTEADYHSLEAGLQLVSEDTGGFYGRMYTSHRRAIDALVGALAGHYVLFVERPPLDRGQHGISVKLTRRKGTLLARKSYVSQEDTRTGHEDSPRTPDGSRVVAQPPSPVPCRVTTPLDSPFVPPPPYPRVPVNAAAFWHGTPALWTIMPEDGRWSSLPRGEHGYRQKVFLWSPGYDGRREQSPKVTIKGRRLDGPSEPIWTEQATNAYHRDLGGWAMLGLVELPTAGCWELEAAYGGSTLTFTVDVAR